MSPDRNILLYPYLTLQTSLKSFRYKATVEPSPLSNRSLSPRNTVYAATPTTVKLTSNSVAAVTVLCSSTSHDFTTTFSNHMVRNVSYLSIASHLPSSTPNPPRLYLSCSFASSPPYLNIFHAGLLSTLIHQTHPHCIPHGTPAVRCSSCHFHRPQYE